MSHTMLAKIFGLLLQPAPPTTCFGGEGLPVSHAVLSLRVCTLALCNWLYTIFNLVFYMSCTCEFKSMIALLPSSLHRP